MINLSAELDQKRKKLLTRIRSYGCCAVAFSAGVDSTVLAKAAVLALADRAVAVTGVSPSLADEERKQARQLAELIGIRHIEVQTDELQKSEYAANEPDRCYHCKTELYRQIQDLGRQLAVEVIANGANADDLHDYRPGNRAADEQQVDSPLAACGFTKSDVRQLARFWDLPVWDKPAAPCLSSRIAYGQRVTPERLAMIEHAEQFLKSFGCVTVRVRYHEGDLARIEVPASDLMRLSRVDVREVVVERFRELGFKFVTLDLAGFRSGSLNVLVSQETLNKETMAAKRT